MNNIFEKLLPARFWKKAIPLSDDQLWNAFAASPNPQSLAVLHVAQDKFVSHMQTAASPEAASELRLRALDRAMAIADLMSEVDSCFVNGKTEAQRREAARQVASQMKS